VEDRLMARDPSTPQRYYDASQERFNEAVSLFALKQYSGASYLAGCAIEAMFWTFIPEQEAPGHRGRHDLQRLYEAGLGKKLYAQYNSKFRGGLASDTPGLQKFEKRDQEISRYLTESRLRWTNSYRYYPDALLRSMVNRDPTLRAGATGDVLRTSVDVLIVACQFFIALGMTKRKWIQ